jgi:hypothetical protein
MAKPAQKRAAMGNHGQSSSVNDNQGMLFYLVDWLPPDFGAVGQYGVIFSRDIARTGRHVHLIGLGREDCGTVREIFGDGILDITRLPAKPFNKSSNFNRLTWILKSNFRLIYEVIKHPKARNADVLFTGSPPFMLFFALLCKWLRGARLIYRITDFYPEVLFAAWGRKPALAVIFEKLTWFFRRRVDEIQVLGEDQRKLMLAGGIRPERITLKRDISPIHISGNEKPALCPPALKGRKILLYSGNFGAAHEIETITRGLVWHYRQGSGQFGLWLNASGSGIQPVTEILHSEGIPYALNEPSALHQLPAVLAAADVHLVSLRPGFSGYVLPSKIYGCLSSGRPILYVGPASSDVHLLCSLERTKDYEHVDAGDVEGFSDALERLANHGLAVST